MLGAVLEMECRLVIRNLTEARIRDLLFASGIHRDEQLKDLMVICHKTMRSYAVQGDVRHVRTVRVKIDRCDRIGSREARNRAKALMSQIRSGVDPTEGAAETGITLARALKTYLRGIQAGRGNPSIAIVGRLAAVLGCHPSALLNEGTVG
ncbi:hypothetical protein [Sphingobium yanoikuyae]|uniref:hypothetical protein n=1 Tax=Sphingobium yanoikuyae TaxID=13690 RepID=UPI00242B49CA|nr:hypothetical protein [Sphingobium yanoikuyae]